MDYLNYDFKTILILSAYINLVELKKICDKLKSNTTITELVLNNCNINDAGVKCIAKVLKINSVIKILRLSGNKIGNKGVKYIVDALNINPLSPIQTIDLSTNRIDDKGLEYMAELLKTNKSLSSLYLGHNSISSKGFEYMCDIFKTNKTLIEIGFSGFIQNNSDMICFSNMLKENNTLEIIMLYNTLIHKMCDTDLMQILQKNSSIIKIHGWHNCDSQYIYGRNIHNRYQKSVTLMELIE